ncbi:IS110 family transposase [Coralloluteibacterium stylophorae]|uniref:IS110 family transposase n=1 Tax=Coralloluteibacterium stylophorae TaxID=1776034 RepID=A0A8J7VWB0_9GAMM|nr:IS110 family transposase [Coralloluteibacterium stylophorae]MBS7458188.1 IS110 family transposase [Coralloluteibacterium stylophorae]
MSQLVGVDVAKRSFDLATPLPNGKHRTKARLRNDEAGFKLLHAWLAQHVASDAWVVMEATGSYHEALAEYVHGLGYRVAVLNPAQVASYAKSQLQRVKTDRTDAKLLATYAQRHLDQLRPWQPDPPALKRLRALVRRLQDLQEMAQMEQNRLDVASANVDGSIQQVLAHLRSEIDRIQREIDDHIDNDPTLRQRRDLLVSIDGIAQRTAALLLAELGDATRFRDAGAVTAFAGLNPKLQESGTYRGHVRISRIGSARLRRGLYMPALVALSHNPVLQALKQRLKLRGKCAKQIICAAMRRLLRIVYGVLKSGQPFDPARAVAR